MLEAQNLPLFKGVVAEMAAGMKARGKVYGDEDTK
jgi:hypothetical protein